MFAFRLWRALNNPPVNHPLFQWVLQNARHDHPMFTTNFFLWLAMLVSIGFCWVLTNTQVAIAITIVVFVVNTLYGIRLSSQVAASIYEARDKRRYELLSALPAGNLLTSWAICTGYLHSRASFRWVAYGLQALVILSSLLLIAGLGITVFVLQNQRISTQVMEANLAILPILVACLIMVALAYIDHRHSAMIGILLGIIVPINADDDYYVRFKAISAMIILQALTYMIWFISLRYVLQYLQSTGLDVLPLVLLEGLLAILSLWLIRDFSVRGLWMYCFYQLNAENHEQDDILRMAIR